MYKTSFNSEYVAKIENYFLNHIHEKNFEQIQIFPKILKSFNDPFLINLKLNQINDLFTLNLVNARQNTKNYLNLVNQFFYFRTQIYFSKNKMFYNTYVFLKYAKSISFPLTQTLRR